MRWRLRGGIRRKLTPGGAQGNYIIASCVHKARKSKGGGRHSSRHLLPRTTDYGGLQRTKQHCHKTLTGSSDQSGVFVPTGPA